LYRRVLGPQFDSLPPVLQRFHGQPGPARASGQLSVRYGPGRLARWVGSVWRLPREGELQPATVAVEPRGGVEIWRRSIGGRSFVTRQWQSGALLIEALGVCSLGLEVSVERDELRLLSRRFWWCGVPIPAGLAPRVAAVARPTPRGWNVEVHVSHSWLGHLLSYEGEVIPQ
jgi:hypothetical protein